MPLGCWQKAKKSEYEWFGSFDVKEEDSDGIGRTSLSRLSSVVEHDD